MTAIAAREGLSFDVGHEFARTPTADLVVYFNPRTLIIPTEPWRGSHMVRDPRDMVVSSYYYHRWSDEGWLRDPVSKIVETEQFAGFGSCSYQDCLNELDPHDGLLLEIERFGRWEGSEMSLWDFGRPAFLELRYEDVLSDEAGQLERLFQHYEFSSSVIRRSVEQASSFSLDRMLTREGTHVRSGLPGQWRELFEEEHVARFKARVGDLVTRLGYERDRDWH